MTTTSGSPRSTRRVRRVRRRVAAGALLAAGVGLATLSAASAAPAAAKQSTTPVKVEGARTASSVRPATAPNCPTSTYPTSPTSKTGYGVAFTAALLDGSLNAGYHETPNPSGDAYAPWGLHLGSITGTVCGLIQLPSLNLSATPSDIQVATYGEITGPASLGPGQTGAFSFTGLADPGANEVAFNIASFYPPGGQSSSESSVAYYDTGRPQELSVSHIVLGTANQSAATPPGPQINGIPQPYNGSVTLTNNSGRTVTNIQGEEPTGFIDGPTTLAPRQSATYTYTAVGLLLGSENIALSFRGETKSGPVTGFGVAYFTVVDASGPAFTVGNIMINGSPASSAPGPALSPGSAFTATFTLTNDSTTGTMSGMASTFSSTDQYPSVLALVSLPGESQYGYDPFGLQGFNLSVDVPCTPGTSGADCPADLFTSPNGICGASDLLPPNYCLPANALSAAGVTSADAVFTTVNPLINCDQDVSVKVTTGRSTVVPQQVTGRDRNLPAWTMEGQGIVGPLVGAEGAVVANDFGLTVRNTPTPQDPDPMCDPWDGVFDQIAGGVTPANSPVCKPQHQSFCYYNGKNPTKVTCLLNTAENICGPPGEVQLSAEVVITSVDLPNYNPKATAVRRG